MPRLTTPTTAMIRRASHLPATSPIRQAARDELAAIRAACPTVAALCAALRCGERHARRLLASYDLPRYAPPRVAPVAVGHPPARWCSCAACRVARGAAYAALAV